MTFGKGIEELKNKYPEHMILVKNGIFYNAIGNDALILEKELEMKKLALV